MYTHKTAEDNTNCLQELTCIVHDTKEKVFVDEFNHHSEFYDGWKKLYNTYLSNVAKDTSGTFPDNKIWNFKHDGT